ncbi:MAG: LysR substrate-binding domain-containing protein [Roseiarcus sp.]
MHRSERDIRRNSAAADYCQAETGGAGHRHRDRDLEQGKRPKATRGGHRDPQFSPHGTRPVAKKIRDVPARLYATSAYLERIGNPKLPHDLRHADFISIDNSGMFLKGLNALGLNLTQRNFPIFTENYLVMWELVKHGLGIGVLDGNIGDAEPLVRRALPNLEPLMFPIWLVAHREVNTSRRIRVTFDLLAEELAAP